MKELFRKYKSVLRFLLLFLGSYIVLSLIYGGYLKLSIGDSNTSDFITQLVAEQSNAVLNSLGYNAEVLANESLPSMQLWVEGVWVGRIIEGCNAISIIILFAAFIFSFAVSFKRTLVFFFAGATLIYAVNIVRIAILAIALYQYPQYQEILHTVVFPGIIYSLVFVLWVVWVRNLNLGKKNDSSFQGGERGMHEG
ncbi:MAG TPA: exosortase family protein XrtF [Flavobacteriaceae bacterium]|nr:exosortase family protein XrtF [Flavobacteriaceae bacterium]HAT64611.1 exosortase family protein XrtF [Flavobacteriaceae bacterium]|tara:strand:- start:158058 stop:158645 length:588 start_codon:yes stop_codon:yes gene_type:complete